MSKVTEKSTKAQILEEVARLEKELAAAKASKQTVAQVQEAKVTVARKESAKEIIGMNILNETITKQYQDVIFAIETAVKELAEIQEVKEAIINAEAVIMAKDALIAERELREVVRISELRTEAERVAEEKKLTLTLLEKEYKEQKESLEKERKREAEEYAYNLKRQRQIENDKWDDEKALRLKAIADREVALDARQDALHDVEVELKDLREAVDQMPGLLIKAKEEGYVDAKKAFDREKAIEINAVKKNAEWEIKMANLEKDRAVEDLAKATDKISMLEAKLEAAYASMNTLATTTVQSTGGVKILETGKDK